MNRNFGLDMIRSIAIIMVLISHSKLFFLPYFDNKLFALGIFGYYGVELFFVLSGFLIGSIILKQVVNRPSFFSIFSFYIRRWFRTIPAYYLVLVLLIILNNINVDNFNYHLQHFLFLQNFNNEELDFFGVAWSLSVEEWFYLLMPIVFCIISKTNLKKHINMTIICLIIVIFILRCLFVFFIDPSWDNGVRKFVPLRFDSLLFGILLASLKLNCKHIYQKLTEKYILMIAFIGLTVIGLFFISNMKVLNQSFFFKTIGFSLVSCCMVCCIPFFEYNSFINTRLKSIEFIHCFFTKTSLWSYMIYLVHLDIFVYLNKMSTSLLSAFYLWGGSIGIVLIISALTYRYYEKPIMDLRDCFSNTKVEREINK